MMVLNRAKLWTILAVLTFCLQYSLALNCYKCSESSYPNRDQSDKCDGFPANIAGLCRPTDDVCYKFILGGPDGSKTITRGCGTKEFCYNLNKIEHSVTSECHSCNHDQCNAATTSTSEAVIFISIFFSLHTLSRLF